MLSEKATNLTVKLCSEIKSTVGGKDFKILSWEEIAKIAGLDGVDEDLKQTFEELRLNQCIVQKYKDDEEVCFALTDKAILLKQDLDTMEKVKKNEISTPIVKTDDEGNSVVVLPKSNHELQKQYQPKTKVSQKVSMFFTGLFGGAVGGALVYGIIYLLTILL